LGFGCCTAPVRGKRHEAASDTNVARMLGKASSAVCGTWQETGLLCELSGQ
jgi:hypothetical protein